MSIAFEIESAEHEAEVLSSMILATYDAIYNGCTDYEAFEGALYAVFSMSHDHKENLKKLSNEAFMLLREGGEKKAQ